MSRAHGAIRTLRLHQTAPPCPRHYERKARLCLNPNPRPPVRTHPRAERIAALAGLRSTAPLNGIIRRRSPVSCSGVTDSLVGSRGQRTTPAAEVSHMAGAADHRAPFRHRSLRLRALGGGYQEAP